MSKRIGWWLGAILAGVVFQSILWRISQPAQLFNDFYKGYYPVAEQLLNEGPRATWHVAGSSTLVFVNIPILAYLFEPLALLGAGPAGWTFLGMGVVATIGAFAALSRLAGLKGSSAVALLFLFSLNGPLVNSLREGNTTHFVLLFLVASLLLWRNGWVFTAGLVLGFCALIKLPLLLYGPCFLLRRRWRLVAGITTTVAVAAILSVAIFGADNTFGWYEACIHPFLHGFLGAFNVQSIDGFLTRLTSGDAHLWDWEPLEPTAVHSAVRLLVFAAMFGAAYVVMRRVDRSGPHEEATGYLSPAELLEFGLVLNLALVTSPIAWTHYYLLLLLPFGLYLGGMVGAVADAATRRLMRCGLALVSLPVVMPQLGPGWGSGLVARTAVSAWLFGGLLTLAALMRGSWCAAAPHPER